MRGLGLEDGREAGIVSATLREAVAEYFRANPGRWVSAYELMKVGGSMAWRTRVSEVRRMGLNIENRVDRDSQGVAQSFYRYSPPVKLKQPSLWGAA